MREEQRSGPKTNIDKSSSLEKESSTSTYAQDLNGATRGRNGVVEVKLN